LSDDKRDHYEQEGVGHYGVFNGSRFRSEIAPRISAFIRKQDHELGEKKAASPANKTASKPAAKRAPRSKPAAKK
jgi:poly(3-hydroxybutyrate) depolymerase